MKKIAYLFALVLTFAFTGHAHAQRKDDGKMSGGKMSGGKMSGGKMDAGQTQSFTGPVKGSPTGDTFILALRKGPITVDMSKAKVRADGKFAKKDMIRGGGFVTVVGKMSGSTFMADSVTVKSLPGGKKVGGDKMGGKMDTPKSKMVPGKTKM